MSLTNDLLNVLSSTRADAGHAEQEILLQTSLARALLAVRGYTPEVEAAYRRALELAEAAGELPQLFPVLRSLASLYLYVGQREKAIQMGEKILSLAERQDDDNLRVEGHLVLGSNQSMRDDLEGALKHLEQGIALYNPERQQPRRFRLGNNPGVACFMTSALYLLYLGFPDRALHRANEGVNLADRLAHPYSKAYALFHTGLLHLWRREVEMAHDRAGTAIDVAEEHDFQVWRAVATCVQGAALVGMRRPDDGLEQVRRGISLYQGLKTPPIFWPLLLYVQSWAYLQASKPEQGLSVLDQAMQLASNMPGRMFAPEFLRLKADFMVAASPENVPDADAVLAMALGLAQDLRIKWVELRVALSLGRLWRAQGKVDESRRVVGEAYAKLTEGYTTPDLVEARDLLQGKADG